MDHQEDREQLLWEFVYGLLPERDAAELRKLITSDPEVAREYVRVKQRSELVADAARVEVPPIELQKPTRRSVVLSRTLRSLGTSQFRSIAAKAGNVLIAAAAAVLLCMIGYGYVQPRTRSVAQPVAVDLVRAEVCGPRAINPETSNLFSVQTNSVSGQPLSTRVTWSFHDARGNAQLQQELVTDTLGRGQIELPRSLARSAVELKVRAGDSGESAFAANLTQAEPRQMTYIALDKREYRPGETIQYRSVTLSQLGLVSDHESTVEFRVKAAGQDTSLAGPQQVQTRRGVSAGSLPLPAKTAPGKYRLVASSPAAEFDGAVANFVVRDPRDLDVKLQLARNRQANGDEVVGQIQVFRASGEPASGAKLKADATVDDRSAVAVSEPALADSEGMGEVRLQLRPEHSNRPGIVNLQVTDRDGEATLAQQIPADGPEVDIKFYPEGGELAAGFANRVYFTSRTRAGEPVELTGSVVDSNRKEVAAARTTSDGRGVFTITPEMGADYRLELPSSAQIEVAPIPLPSPSRARANLNVEQAVLPAGSPVTAELRADQPEPRLLVVAYCRGVLVGQQWIGEAGYGRQEGGYACRLQVPLSAEASGAIRLVAFDYQDQPPVALSERLVFRRPARRVNLKVEPVAAAGRHRLRFESTDQQMRPLEAVLGVQVTRIASGRVGSNELAMAPYYYLAMELDRPQEIGDGLRYLDETPEAAEELELLLGTQSAHRVRLARVSMFAQSSPIRLPTSAGQEVSRGRSPESRADQESLVPAAEDLLASVAVSPPELASPVLFSNAAELESAARVAEQPAWELDLAFLGRLLVWGGAALAVLAIVFAVLRYPQRSLYLAPIYATSLGALVVGAMWISERPAGERQLALAPQSPAIEGLREHALAEREASGTEGLAAGRLVKQNAPETSVERNESKDVLQDFAAAAPPAPSAPREEVAERRKPDAAMGLTRQPSPPSPAKSDEIGSAFGMPEMAPGMAPGMAGNAMGAGAAGGYGGAMGAGAAGGYGGAPGALGGGVAMKAAPPEESAPPAPAAPAPAAPAPAAPAPPASAGTVDKFADNAKGKAEMSFPAAEAPAPSPAAGVAPEPSPAPAAAPALADQLQMSKAATPSAPRRDPAPMGRMSRAAGGEQSRDNKMLEQLQRRFMFAPEVTLAWLPRLELNENGKTTVDLPKAGAARVRVRADAHSDGHLGSVDMTLDLPDPTSR